MTTGRRAGCGLVLTVAVLFTIGNLASADPPFVVKPTGPAGSHPWLLCHVDGVLFYRAYDGIHGEELWRSDGTEDGTYMVKDIRDDPPGPFAQGCRPHNLTAVGEMLFFVARDGVHGNELWVSDGAEPNTVMVRDIWPGQSSSLPTQLVNMNGTLFFAASSEGSGDKLWKSDGTAAGTVMVMDADWWSVFPTAMIVINDTLFFVGSDTRSPYTGTELWKSDGTRDGTVLVKDINPFLGSFPRHLTRVGDILFFFADDGTHGLALWKSDGSEAGTMMVKDIDTEHHYSGYFPDHCCTAVVDSNLFFVFDDGTHGWELWRSDGTESGTAIVRDIDPNRWEAPAGLTAVGKTLFFSADDRIHGRELWLSDGTEEGTRMIKDICQFLFECSSRPTELTAVNDVLYFFASGVEPATAGLWRSDGTEDGTVRVSDEALDVTWLTNADGTLFFRGSEAKYGNELWCYRPDFGDIDGDRDVDIADFAAFSRSWQQDGCNLTNSWCNGGDISDFGVVDFSDLNKLADNWLMGTLP